MRSNRRHPLSRYLGRTSEEAAEEASEEISEETSEETLESPLFPITPNEDAIITEPTSSTPSASITTDSHAWPTGQVPPPAQFLLDNGTKWTISYVGDIQYTGLLATKNLVGDKCRSSKLGNKVIWNFGDMWCDFDYTICGFAMGPAMYGTDDVMVVNTTGIETHLQLGFPEAT